MQDRRKLLENYVQSHLQDVLKAPHDFIRYPFIDPGAGYQGNCWDWDTYWCVYSLFSLRDLFTREQNEAILRHARGNVMNFLDHQLEDGYIPMMIEVSHWSEPYLNMRHKEGVQLNMHKPFLCNRLP